MIERVKKLALISEALDENFQHKIAAAEIDVAALEMTELRVMSALSLGQSVGTWASMLKLQGSTLIQRIDELALEALGGYALPDQRAANVGLNEIAPVGPHEGYTVSARYFYDRAITIYGGTSEVQRNILARAVLGL